MERLKAVLGWIADHVVLVLMTIVLILGFVIKLLFSRNAELKAENIAEEEKGKLEEMKHEDEKQTQKTNNAIDDYSRIRDEYLKGGK